MIYVLKADTGRYWRGWQRFPGECLMPTFAQRLAMRFATKTEALDYAHSNGLVYKVVRLVRK